MGHVTMAERSRLDVSRKLPPFNAVKAFEAAARHGSFARAAQELSVTSTAISQHVKGLEAWLGEPLFVRRANKVALTEAGNRFLPDVTRLLDQLAALLPPKPTGEPLISLTVAISNSLSEGCDQICQIFTAPIRTLKSSSRIWPSQ